MRVLQGLVRYSYPRGALSTSNGSSISPLQSFDSVGPLQRMMATVADNTASNDNTGGNNSTSTTSSNGSDVQTEKSTRVPVTGTYQDMRIQDRAAAKILAGHPWVFSNSINGSLKNFQAGEIVNLVSQSNISLGTATVNPQSNIVARLLTPERNVGLEVGQIRKRITAACSHRAKTLGEESRYCRMINGEGDKLPGIIVDRYGDILVLQTAIPWADQQLDTVVSVLKEICNPTDIVLRNDTKSRVHEGLEVQEPRVLLGSGSGDTVITVDGLQYHVNVFKGQKTGFFYDQRANRKVFSPLIAPGTSVLDLYSYIGAWGFTAARQGAKEVTCVDSSATAIAYASESRDLNKLDSITFNQSLVEEAMDMYRTQKRRFDTVIVDPPALVQGRQHKNKGMSKYVRINSRAMQLVRKGGYLITSSCSHQLTNEEFLTMLQRAAKMCRRQCVVVGTGSMPTDHPVPLQLPQFQYLKCVALAVL